MSERITDAELAAMKGRCEMIGNVSYRKNVPLLLREVEELTAVANNAADEIDALRRTVDLYAKEKEELRAALRDARNEALEEAARLHEQLYVAHDDAMTAIVKYRDAIRAIKARAALGDESNDWSYVATALEAAEARIEELRAAIRDIIQRWDKRGPDWWDDPALENDFAKSINKARAALGET